MTTPPDEPHAFLDAESTARLKHINVQLDALQIQIHEPAKAYRVQLAQAASNLGNPTNDIWIETELVYNLSPTDPRYDPTFEHSDNRVGCRTLYCTDSPDLLNFGIHEPHSVIGPQGWLFHNLTEHDNGPDQPPVAPAELLNVDSIDVNLEIRYSMRVKLETDTRTRELVPPLPPGIHIDSTDLEVQLKLGREFMHDYRDTFHELAK